MGKSQRERQRTQQKKREKQKSKRQGSGSPQSAPSKDRAFATQNAVRAIAVLLGGGGRMPQDIRRTNSEAEALLGGSWVGLASRVESFLFDQKPWDLRLEQVLPLQAAFLRGDERETFERLALLSLSNDPQFVTSDHFKRLATEDILPGHVNCDFIGALSEGPIWAVVFWGLDKTLASTDSDAKPFLAALRAGLLSDCGRATASEVVAAVKSLRQVLRPQKIKKSRGSSAVIVSPPDSASNVGKAIDQAQAILQRFCSGGQVAGWAACFKIFVRRQLTSEGWERASGFEIALHRPELGALLLSHPLPEWAFSGDTAALSNLRYQSRAPALRKYLMTHVPKSELSYRERIRFELVLLKLLCVEAAKVRPGLRGEGVQVAAAFSGLFGMLDHGVPPSERAFADKVRATIVSFYCETCLDLRLLQETGRTTAELLGKTPQDFRLACMALVAATELGDKSLGPMLPVNGYRHVDPEVFFKCANWLDVANARTSSRVRELLFEPLAREERKACLSRLLSGFVTNTGGRAKAHASLLQLWPYLGGPNFLLEDIRNKVAIESDLLFFCALGAALLRQPMMCFDLTQFRQFLGHIIGSRSATLELALRFLIGEPCRWLGEGVDATTRMRMVLTHLPAHCTQQLRPLFADYLAAHPGLLASASVEERVAIEAFVPSSKVSTRARRSNVTTRKGVIDHARS